MSFDKIIEKYIKDSKEDKQQSSYDAIQTMLKENKNILKKRDLQNYVRSKGQNVDSYRKTNSAFILKVLFSDQYKILIGLENQDLDKSHQWSQVHILKFFIRQVELEKFCSKREQFTTNLKEQAKLQIQLLHKYKNNVQHGVQSQNSFNILPTRKQMINLIYYFPNIKIKFETQLNQLKIKNIMLKKIPFFIINDHLTKIIKTKFKSIQESGKFYNSTDLSSYNIDKKIVRFQKLIDYNSKNPLIKQYENDLGIVYVEEKLDSKDEKTQKNLILQIDQFIEYANDLNIKDYGKKIADLQIETNSKVYSEAILYLLMKLDKDNLKKILEIYLFDNYGDIFIN